MANFWDTKQVLGPSAGLVQRHFVEARKSELYRRNPALEAKVRVVLKEELPEVDQSGDKWIDVYGKINKWLQASDLTINFEAENWFSEENTYESYKQMYELAEAQHGRGFVSDTQRARVDDTVTFPQAWNAPARPTQPLPGPKPGQRRGLSPGLQSGQRIQRQMAFGSNYAPVIQEDVFSNRFGSQIGSQSQNRYFNPKTKQIFAALNWSRAPNGAAVNYGHSYLVLNPKIKVNALYFPGDTFLGDPALGRGANASMQVAFHTLGAIIGTNPYEKGLTVLPGLARKCYYGTVGQGYTQAKSLIEGHIFSELPFNGNVQEVCVYKAIYGSPIHRNAKKFASRIGAKLVLFG